MNLAISTIVIFFLLIVPGLIFRRFYYTSEFSKQYFKSVPFHSIISSIFPGIIIQGFFSHIINLGVVDKLSYFLRDSVFCNFLNQFKNVRVDYESVIDVLIGFQNSEPSLDFSNIVSKDLGNIFFYSLSLWFCSAFIGYVLKLLVRKFKLDRQFKIFRFQNEWHYLFSGEIYDYPKFKERHHKKNKERKGKKLFWTEIDAFVELNGFNCLYQGILDEYILSNDNGVNRIYLSEVKRCLIDSSGVVKESKKSIPGDFFTIDYGNVKNMNLTYVHQKKEPIFSIKNQQRYLNILLLIFSVFIWFHDLFFKIDFLSRHENYWAIKWSFQFIFLGLLMSVSSFIDYKVKKNANANEDKKINVKYDIGGLFILLIGLIWLTLKLVF